ncbi:hypothetical protein [Flexibacterium corallicola]|uniref:hypothetical protein n=1 Tax=Flexibacterium corallicola TaxID=3037259 RepID=UPI00286EF7D5|nr:hypothetical protein [Pseudovibrio sp. M1P-2-3]
MLPSSSEIVRSFQGSIELMRAPNKAASYFDLSNDGFWRSFSVIFLLLPFYALSMVARERMLATAGGGQTNTPQAIDFGVMLATSVLDWVTFPIVIALLASTLGIKGQYASYISVRNWTSLLIILPMSFLNLLFIIGILSVDVLLTLSLLIMGWMLWYRFMIARVVAGASVGVAIGLVVLDILLSILIENTMDTLI